MIPLSNVLLLSGILFSLSVAGIFINRKNVLLLLMCIELMLLAVNFNFIAFSHYLGDLSGHRCHRWIWPQMPQITQTRAFSCPSVNAG